MYKFLIESILVQSQSSEKWDVFRDYIQKFVKISMKI